MSELYTEEQMNVTKHRLRLLRKEKSLSYENLSLLLQKQGTPISHTNLRNYELTDKNNPLYNRTRGMSVENLVALACVYQVSLEYILGYSDERVPMNKEKMQGAC